MSEQGRDPFEIPKEMRSMAEAGFDQARQAFEKFLSGAQATAGTIEEKREAVRAGAKDIGAKAMSYAEKNVQASLDYAQSLLHAKDLTEIMRLHSEYVQTHDFGQILGVQQRLGIIQRRLDVFFGIGHRLGADVLGAGANRRPLLLDGSGGRLRAAQELFE